MQDNQHDDAGRGDVGSAFRKRMAVLQRQLCEAFDQLWDSFVDPADALYDRDGLHWLPLAGGPGGTCHAAVPADEQQLATIRNACRTLAVTNEFAINGHENRISYIVGSGHAYRVVPRRGPQAAQLPETLRRQVQAEIDEFLRANKWHLRQQEIVRREDRDGECFLRFFVTAEGRTAVRFVEPAQVAAPRHRIAEPAASFGIQTDPHDVETVLGYWIDGQFVEAQHIQHRKANVDANVKRGLPLFYPVLKNLRRAEKLLRNMSVVAEIQSAIAIIRKHREASAATLEQFLHAEADLTVTEPGAGKMSHFRRYGPGTILDATAGVDYEFPAAGIDASRFVAVLQAELRAIASRLVMPEFMLTSDASNANYASTMVAEGPAVKMFQRLQYDMIADDLEVMRRVLADAVAAGRLPAEVLDAVEIRAIPPSLAVRDRLRDAQADQILLRCGAMSPSTMALRHGLDPEEETAAHTWRPVSLRGAYGASAGCAGGD